MLKYMFLAAVVFCYIIKDNKVLLIKRNNPPARNQYTVIGGKKEKGENIVNACIREVYEETNLMVSDLKLVGIINNYIENYDRETLTFYFIANSFCGELKSSQEGDLEWCDIEASYEKEGISEFYVKISPLVFDNKELFVGDVLIDKNGLIKSISF